MRANRSLDTVMDSESTPIQRGRIVRHSYPSEAAQARSIRFQVVKVPKAEKHVLVLTRCRIAEPSFA